MSGLFLGRLYEINTLTMTVGRYRLVCMFDREKILERVEENFDRLPVNIIGLGQHVQDLLHKSLDAYMELNIDKAMNIWESDIDTDRLYLSIFKEILSYMSENPDDAKMLTHLIFISKNLERVGDYTTSIAKQTYFLIEGTVPQTKRPKAMTTF